MVNYCPYCGKKVENDFSFCNGCGKRINKDMEEANEKFDVSAIIDGDGRIYSCNVEEAKESTNDNIEPTSELNSLAQKKKTSKAGETLDDKQKSWYLAGGIFIVGVIIMMIIFLSLSVSEKRYEKELETAELAEKTRIIEPELESCFFVARYNAQIRGTVHSNSNKSHVDDEKYIAAAKTLVDKILKNPTTAIFNSERIYEKDNFGRAIVYLDVSGQNSYGGWVRQEYYVAINGFQNDDQFNYNPSFYYINEPTEVMMISLKGLNNFGDDPRDSEVKDLLMDEDKLIETFNNTGNTNIKVLKYSFDNHDLLIYIDNKTDYVVAVSEEFTKNGSPNCRKEFAAAISAMIGKSMSDGYDGIALVFDENNTIISDGQVFERGVLYESKDLNGTIKLSATIMSEDDYTTTNYWTPLHKDKENITDVNESSELHNEEIEEEQNTDELKKTVPTDNINNVIEAKKMFEMILNGKQEISFEDLSASGSIDVYTEEPADYNNNAHYSIVGRGFSPIYDTDCIEVVKANESWIFLSNGFYYKIIKGMSDTVYIYYASSREGLIEEEKTCCGMFMLSMNASSDNQRETQVEVEKEGFYGVWCAGAYEKSGLEKIETSLIDVGYTPIIVSSTEWSNLGSNPYYYISSGKYTSEEEAKAELDIIKKRGLLNAYVTYTEKY